MQTIADVLATAADREEPAVVAPSRTSAYTHAEVAAHAWQVGNLLSQYGVHDGARVPVVVGPTAPTPDDEPGRLGTSPVPVLAMLGAMADGALVDPHPPAAVDGAVLVVPTAWLDRYQPGPGTKPISYGASPDDPAVAHLEGEAWSENPMAPPASLDPTTPALATDATYTHGELLAASHRIVAEYGLDESSTVAIDAGFGDAGTFVAGVLAPLRAGARITLGVSGDDADAGSGDGADVDLVVGTGEEPDRVEPSAARPR